MQQKVKVRETLTVHILDEDGNIVKTEEFRPPRGPIEKIATKLGILKNRHNTVHNSGLNVMAQRLVWDGVLDPVNWVACRRSHGGDYRTGAWHFRSATTLVGGDVAFLKNDIQRFTGGATMRYDMVGTAYSNATDGGWGALGLVSYIDGIAVDMTNAGDSLMVEIQFDFDSS